MTRARDLADSADKDISGTLTLDDIVLSNDLTVADNGKAIFGAGSDLQIYHDGSNSYIDDNGTGDLRIRAESFLALSDMSNRVYLTGESQGAVGLRFNDAQKLATTSTGIDVTGGVSIDDDNNFSFGDGTTYIQGSGAADRIKFITAGSEAVRIDSSGNVGIGTSSPSSKLELVGTGFTDSTIRLQRTDSGENNDAGLQFTANAGANSGHGIGGIWFKNSLDGNSYALIRARTDDSTGTSGRLDFITSTSSIGNTTAPSMRIDSSGNVIFGSTSTSAPTMYFAPDSGGGAFVKITDSTNARNAFTFNNPNGMVGFIETSGSSTSYSTSSDYRLKTNAQPMTGATDRLKHLNPVNFEWIADGTRVDGFLAHEAQAVVPEAVTGTKDEVDDDGNPVYQGIDQSKLVPLLVATIKELEARITALEGV